MGTAGCGRTAVGLIVTPTAFNLDRLVSDCSFFVQKNLWCGACPVACARPKSKRTQPCTLGCTSGADIWRACSANQRKNKIHQQVCSSPANGRADARRPVGGRASLSCFLSRKRASLSHHWKRHRWALVLAPLGVQSLRSGLGRTEQQEGDAL